MAQERLFSLALKHTHYLTFVNLEESVSKNSRKLLSTLSNYRLWWCVANQANKTDFFLFFLVTLTLSLKKNCKNKVLTLKKNQKNHFWILKVWEIPMLVKKLAMQSMATNLIAPPRSRRDLRLRPRSVRQSSLDRMSSQKKKKTVYGPEVPAGLQKTRKPNGTHPLNSPKQGIMQDVNKSKLRSIKRNNSNRASKPRKQSLRNIYMAKPKVFIIG